MLCDGIHGSRKRFMRTDYVGMDELCGDGLQGWG